MLLVFDLDGTLIDSRRDIADSVNQLIADCGGAPLPEEQIGKMVGDGAVTLVRRAFAAAGLALPPDALASFLEIYDSRLVVHTRVYDGLLDALDALRSCGPAAVLTNKPLAQSRRILDALSLSRYFSHVIGGDGPFGRKPAPDGLLHLSDMHQATPAQTMLIGDSRVDWQTATNAGTALCLARYGFGYDGVPLEYASHVELAVDDPSQLPAVLSAWCYRVKGSS